MTETDIITAVQARAWYPLAAIALWYALKLWKAYGAGRLLPRVPEGYRWVPPLVIAGATGFVDGYLTGLPLNAALWRGAFALFTIGLGSMGVQGAAKESPLFGPSGTLLVIAVLFGAMPPLTACSPTPAHAAEVQREACVCPRDVCNDRSPSETGDTWSEARAFHNKTEE